MCWRRMMVLLKATPDWIERNQYGRRISTFWPFTWSRDCIKHTPRITQEARPWNNRTWQVSERCLYSCLGFFYIVRSIRLCLIYICVCFEHVKNLEIILCSFCLFSETVNVLCNNDIKNKFCFYVQNLLNLSKIYIQEKPRS